MKSIPSQTLNKNPQRLSNQNPVKTVKASSNTLIDPVKLVKASSHPATAQKPSEILTGPKNSQNSNQNPVKIAKISSNPTQTPVKLVKTSSNPVPTQKPNKILTNLQNTLESPKKASKKTNTPLPKTHGLEMTARELCKGDVIFYEMSQFRWGGHIVTQVCKYVLNSFNDLMQSTIGGFPKICHIAVCVEDNSDDPMIIDFVGDDRGELRRIPLSKFGQLASTGKVYVCNTKFDPILSNAAKRAERYYEDFQKGSKEFCGTYDLWKHNCADFVNKCTAMSGYKFTEVQAINKRKSYRCEPLVEFMTMNHDQLTNGYRTIKMKKIEKTKK